MLVRGNCLVHPWWKPSKTHEQNYFELWIRWSGKIWFLFCLLFVRDTRICTHIFTLSPIPLQLFKVFYKGDVPRKSCDHKVCTKFRFLLCTVQDSPGIYKDLDDKCALFISRHCCKGNNPASVESFSVFSEGSFVSWVRHILEEVSSNSCLHSLSLENLGIDPR